MNRKPRPEVFSVLYSSANGWRENAAARPRCAPWRSVGAYGAADSGDPRWHVSRSLTTPKLVANQVSSLARPGGPVDTVRWRRSGHLARASVPLGVPPARVSV